MALAHAQHALLENTPAVEQVLVLLVLLVDTPVLELEAAPAVLLEATALQTIAEVAQVAPAERTREVQDKQRVTLALLEHTCLIVDTLIALRVLLVHTLMPDLPVASFALWVRFKLIAEVHRALRVLQDDTLQDLIEQYVCAYLQVIIRMKRVQEPTRTARLVCIVLVVQALHYIVQLVHLLVRTLGLVLVALLVHIAVVVMVHV